VTRPVREQSAAPSRFKEQAKVVNVAEESHNIHERTPDEKMGCWRKSSYRRLFSHSIPYVELTLI